MHNLSQSVPSILSPIPEYRHRVVGDSDQYSLSPQRGEVYVVVSHRLDGPLKRQHERQIEATFSWESFGHKVELQRSRSPISKFSQSDIGTLHRLTGPIQFIIKLQNSWNINKPEAVSLLGFEESEFDFVDQVLQGHELLRGRDAKDRLSHLFSIRKSLHYFFQDLKAENDWLRESQPMLDGRTPMSLLLGGPMEDILLVREYVDTMVGR